MSSVFSLDRDLNAEEKIKWALCMWQSRAFTLRAEMAFFPSRFGFPAGKADGGTGWGVPGMRRCLHPQNPPKRTSPVPSTQQSTWTRSRQRQHITSAVISLSFLHFPWSQEKFLCWKDGWALAQSAQKICGCGIACSIPGKIPSAITRILFPFCWEVLYDSPYFPQWNPSLLFNNSSRLSYFRPRSVAFSPFNSYFCRVILGRMPPTFCQALVCNYRVRSSSSSDCSSLWNSSWITQLLDPAKGRCPPNYDPVSLPWDPLALMIRNNNFWSSFLKAQVLYQV